MNNHRYEYAMVKLIGSQALISKATSEQTDILLNAAEECDRLEKRIEEDCFFMSGRFAFFANELSEGRITPYSPTAGNTLQDIDTNLTLYKSKISELLNLVRILYDKEGIATFRTSLGVVAVEEKKK